MLVSKRQFLKFSGVAAVAFTFGCSKNASAGNGFTFTKTDAEWRKALSPGAYDVLRREKTETRYSSRLNTEKRIGTYSCVGCGQALFLSKTKFESNTGWPSFYQPLAKSVATSTDYNIGVPRTEVHCARCGGHLGHVFDDGPKPTGKRYCMNGVAMNFSPA
ncbi:MAG: peptide-methionine (R)-S-oxide reductase MsrB [Sphingorhabdus sp.]